ncbi:MAG: SDR family NAD(P)-dependent oxidoreductase [Bacteroidetes bacterium]|nr:SDR family NAD(P)-dependent oxidoreductase [Bacteroidota bacterium]
MHRTYYTLITGASEGLGKALAIECASRKMNLILVALPDSGLRELANFIHKNFMTEVIFFEKDLSIASSCYDLFSAIKNLNLQVQVLINNAGIGGTQLFSEGRPDVYEKQINLNVLATTIITRLFLHSLEKNTPSYILNVGSMASFFSLPKKQVYGGTKSYILSFSKSLRKELKRDNIFVSVLCPGGINTNLPVTMLNKSGTWLSQISVMNPEDVAPIAITGLLKGKEVIIPGTINNFYMFLDKVLPEKIKIILTNYTMTKLKTDNYYTRFLLQHFPGNTHQNNAA